MTSTHGDVLGDERLIRSLAAGVAADDDPVGQLLLALREESREPAEPARPRLRVVPAGREPRRLRRRVAVAVLAGAAVTGVAVGGVSAAASQATPGSGLWGVSRVLYPHRASSLEARQQVQQAIDEARRQEDTGHLPAARRALGRAATALPHVRHGDGVTGLQTQIDHERQRLRSHGTGPVATRDKRLEGKRTTHRGQASPTPTPDPSRSPRPHHSRTPSPDPTHSIWHGIVIQPPSLDPAPSASPSDSPSPSPSTSPSPSPSPSG